MSGTLRRWLILLLVVGLAVSFVIRRQGHRRATSAAADEAAITEPRSAPRPARPGALPVPPPRLTPSRPAGVGWSSPGLCEDGVDARARLRQREALWQTFVRAEVKGVLLTHDRAVPADVLETIGFALGRTRQFADYLLGWSPKDLPPSIYVYASAEQLRSVACINGSNVAYYDGAIHLTGDSHFKPSTLTEETAHEYVHHILTTMGVSRPAWVHEGLAMHIAGERWWKRPELGLEAWLQRDHLPFDALVDGIPHADPDERRSAAAYFQSYRMVGFIRQRRPTRTLRELVDDLAWGRLLPQEAFTAAAAIPPGTTLEDEWARYLRTHQDP